MNDRSSIKRSQHHLKHLLETGIVEEFGLPQRGLAFIVDELRVIGSPPERIMVWATVHFLSLGSPFCCSDPTCHIPLYAEYLDRVTDGLRHQMGLRQEVLIEFAAITGASHAGVEFDDPFVKTGMPTTPVSTNLDDIDQRDALGRTALMRASIRGYDRQVEELLAAGADPSVMDNRGRSILEQVQGQVWITTMLEEALAKHSRT